MSQTILGISACFHDAAACILVDGNIIAAAQEERFTRIKQDSTLPKHAVRYCLDQAGIKDHLDAVVFYEKPIEKFHRILESFLSVAPHGFTTCVKILPGWLSDKLWLPPQIDTMLQDLGVTSVGKHYFTKHHEAHASSAFYPSPFHEAAILTIDAVGEWTTTMLAHGESRDIRLLEEIRYPHSIGFLYSAFTQYCGLRVNRDEYKLMGLAPYGQGCYVELIKRELIDIRMDGSFRLNMKYFGFLDEASMINNNFCQLFGGAARHPTAPLTKREADIACSIQSVVEEIVLLMARHARVVTGSENLCLAGGVALNCVANGRLLREKIFNNVWVQPAADDAGCALGAALAIHHREHKQPRSQRVSRQDGMRGALLGPEYSDEYIAEYLRKNRIAHHELKKSEYAASIAALLAEGKIIGLLNGRMEFGPRALGNRSIIADPRVSGIQSLLNKK